VDLGERSAVEAIEAAVSVAPPWRCGVVPRSRVVVLLGWRVFLGLVDAQQAGEDDRIEAPGVDCRVQLVLRELLIVGQDADARLGRASLIRDRRGQRILEGLPTVLVLGDPDDQHLLEGGLFVAGVSIALGEASSGRLAGGSSGKRDEEDD
jgi:hypothetical protein